MTTTAWAHLPNAAHIDRVLASLEKNPEKWSAAWYAAGNAAGNAAGGAAWDAAWGAVRGAVRGAVWDAAWNAARDEPRDESRDESRDEAQDAAWGAILALIAWDDCAKYLSMTSDQLSMWAALSESPAAILLQPYVRAREQIAQSTINGELTYENH